MRILLAGIGLFCGALQAGVLTGTTATAPVTLAPPVIFTFATNNDNVPTSSPNAALLNATVAGSAPAIQTLLVTPSGGVTEYQFYLTLNNATSSSWIGYRFEILDTAGAPVTGDPFDFDFPQFDSPATGSTWAPTLHTAGILEYQGAAVAPGGSQSIVFAVDIPDPGSLTIRWTPIDAASSSVPEPAAWLTLPGALGLLAWRRCSGVRPPQFGCDRDSSVPEPAARLTLPGALGLLAWRRCSGVHPPQFGCESRLIGARARGAAHAAGRAGPPRVAATLRRASAATRVRSRLIGARAAGVAHAAGRAGAAAAWRRRPPTTSRVRSIVSASSRGHRRGRCGLRRLLQTEAAEPRLLRLAAGHRHGTRRLRRARS